jgi:S1-C subfamily serine protease
MVANDAVRKAHHILRGAPIRDREVVSGQFVRAAAHRYRFAVGVLLLLGLSLVGQAARAGLPETLKQVRQSVVAVGTYQASGRPPSKFRGTGFVVGDGRHIITNEHVLPRQLDSRRREVLAVFLRNGKKIEMREAKVVHKDPSHDLALLSVKGKPFRPMKLGDDRKVREGELYAFTGFPIGMVLGLTPVTHRGIVSAITPIVIPAVSSRELDIKHVQRMGSPYKVFQLDAIAYPGNSGSPLYHPETGQVVGVVNSVFVKETKESVLSSPSGIAYAIPVKYIKKLLNKVK